LRIKYKIKKAAGFFSCFLVLHLIVIPALKILW
jgi:hypothetical protein